MNSRENGSPRIIHRLEVGRCNAAFTGRIGGASAAPFDGGNLADHVGDDPAAVGANRESASVALGIRSDWAVATQVHGIAVAEASPGNCGEADALLVDEPGLPAAIFTADCLPILLSGGSCLAVVHGGWRGLDAGVIQAAAQAMPGRVEFAAIGPSIGRCCYSVGDELAVRFADRFGNRAVVEGPKLDLRYVAEMILRKDCKVDSVLDLGPCTHSEELFSYRLDGPLTGRQALIGWISHD